MIHLISDLHLNPEHPEVFDQFGEYLADLNAGEDLYILGDLFEYWLGDDAVDFLGHAEAQQLLRSLSNRGVKVFFLSGNRDFLVGEKFADECGIQLIADEHILKVGQQQVLLMHGDSLCTDDLSHQKFRAMVRSPGWQKTFLEKTIAERDGLAKLARYHSEDGKAQKNMEIMDVNPEAVRETIAQHDVEILIHGHTHRPAIHRIECREVAYRVVLGDWTPKPSWIQLTEEGLILAFSDSVQRLYF